jgi:hypothetical protein
MQAHPEPVADPADPLEVQAEAESIQRRGAIASQGRLDALLAEAWEIPATLHEIGRLREIAFRAVGEGTGRALDLDRFDASYLHLYLWDREARRIAGAYRLGCTDALLAAGGPDALYTSTLFQFEKPFWDFLTPALELGRSFVAPDYQKSIHPLGLLWRGIGRFVAERPHYARLFGPVSISRDYSSLSKDLIVGFMREHCRAAQFADWIRPRNPYQPTIPAEGMVSPCLKSIAEVSAEVSRLEPDGKGLPVLLRQYLKLSASLLEFNVDPDFSDALDALVLVDLREAPRAMLEIYMGSERSRSFIESSSLRVA